MSTTNECAPNESALTAELNSGENILWRGETCFIMLNRFPYLPGHIMVIPYRQFPKLSDYSALERLELIETVTFAQDLLHKTLDIDSTNVGINTGPQSGCSIPGHLHIHIVPRRPIDMNFMYTVSGHNIRFGGHNATCRDLLKAAFTNMGTV